MDRIPELEGPWYYGKRKSEPREIPITVLIAKMFESTPFSRRKEAIESGLTKYIGTPCKHGHVERSVSNSKCIECSRISKRQRKKQVRQATLKWKNEFHFDHIVPINGITPEGYRVSGLNVPWNLRMINGKENNIKGNRMNERDLEIACSLSKEIS